MNEFTPFHLRIQAHRNEAERLVIASMLMGDEFIKKVESIIGRNWIYFDDKKHMKLFKTIFEICDGAEYPDPVTLSNKAGVSMAEIELIFDGISRHDFELMECESACYYLVACEGGMYGEESK